MEPRRLRPRPIGSPNLQKKRSETTRTTAKRGSPRKNLIQGTPECASPERQPPRHKRGRPQKIPSIVLSERLKEGAIEDSLETPVGPSSPEFIASGTTKLLKLKPPPKSDNYNTSEEHIKVLKAVVSLLVSELIEAPDADRMIDLSVKSFGFLDSIGVDYLPTYEAVHAFISHHCDEESLELQKQSHAVITKARRNESTLSEAKQACSRAQAKVDYEQNKLVLCRARFEELKEELRKLDNMVAEGEAKLAAAEAEMVRAADAHSKAKVDLINISHEMDNAMIVIEDVERRWEEAMAGIRRTRDELLLLRK